MTVEYVGNTTMAQSIALTEWVPTTTTIVQAQALVANAMVQAGGYDVPCNKSVPFIAVPGLIIQTVVGAVYPKGFAIAIETIAAPAGSENLSVSAIAKLTDVVNSGPGVAIQMQGYSLQQSGSARRMGSIGCKPGTEWRYTFYGSPPEYACKCKPNPLCSGATTCSIQPRAND